MRPLAVAIAAITALLPAAALTPAASSAPTRHAVPLGHVYFWSGPNQMGAGGAWDYAPPGYKEAEQRVKRQARSFDSHVTKTVYAISYQNAGRCLYRAIYPDDYSNNWEWAGKFDGVSDTTMGCDQG
ncbi:hypothetical protein ACFWXK_20940 [Streptomyces sp. NPDC059070]|uniref:hypothetical protein n=1 Tax=unclassified Streptomyces TaxID=2593676 RepID=UPI0034E2033F